MSGAACAVVRGDAVSRGEGEGSGDWGLAGLAGRVGALADGSAGWPVAVCSSLVGSGTLDSPGAVSAAARPPMIRLAGRMIASRTPTIVVDRPSADLCRNVICIIPSQINVVQ